MLVRDYHYLICNNDSCIIYEKMKPRLRIEVEPKITISRYNGNNKTILDKGVLIHFWLPLNSEKLYFKTGLIYSMTQINYYDSYETHVLNKIPITIEYIMPGNFLQPKFSYGINAYLFKANKALYTPTLGLGFLLKAFNKVSFSAEINAEFTPVLPALVIFHEMPEWVSYSFDFGLRIRL